MFKMYTFKSELQILLLPCFHVILTYKHMTLTSTVSKIELNCIIQLQIIRPLQKCHYKRLLNKLQIKLRSHNFSEGEDVTTNTLQLTHTLQTEQNKFINNSYLTE